MAELLDGLVPEQPLEVPRCTVDVYAPRASRWCVVIPVIDEGERIRAQLQTMAETDGIPDVVIADGGSTDGSLVADDLRSWKVRALLVKDDEGRLGAQLRMAFAWALGEGYEGVVTIDGNGKDGVEGIATVVAALEEGWDFVQGSRFRRGGEHRRTPLERLLAIRLVHAPLSSLFARHWYTDTTNGFRGHSRRLLVDPRVAVFRSVFSSYELLAYLSIRAPRLGFRVCEVPVRRIYPDHGPTPTKIGKVGDSLDLLRVLWRVGRGRFDPV